MVFIAQTVITIVKNMKARFHGIKRRLKIAGGLRKNMYLV
jgi:hypothetical protein